MAVLKITEKSHINPEAGAMPHYIKSLKLASPEHYHDFYEIFVIVSGRCIHRVNGGEQRLTEGTAVFIRPEDRHYYASDGDNDCGFINIAFSNSIVKGAFNYLGNEICKERLNTGKMPPCAILSTLEKDNFVDRYYRLQAMMSVNKTSARLLFKGLLIELLTQYFLGAWNIASPDVPLWFDSLLKQMQKKENFTAGLHKMYALSGRSVGHLNRCFKKYLNITPTDYINHIRLNYAKYLLLTTNLSIIDISMAAGYQNLSHFNHLFKEHFGMAPGCIRQGKK